MHPLVHVDVSKDSTTFVTETELTNINSEMSSAAQGTNCGITNSAYEHSDSMVTIKNDTPCTGVLLNRQHLDDYNCKVICGHCDMIARYSVSDATDMKIKCLYCGQKSCVGKQGHRKLRIATSILVTVAVILIIAIITLLIVCLSYRMDLLSISLPIIGALFVAVGYVCSKCASNLMQMNSAVIWPVF